MQLFIGNVVNFIENIIKYHISIIIFLKEDIIILSKYYYHNDIMYYTSIIIFMKMYWIEIIASRCAEEQKEKKLMTKSQVFKSNFWK